MYLLEEIGVVMLMLCGALVAAITATWTSWTLLKLVRHPEWGPCLVFIGLMVMVWSRDISSPFLQAVTFFSALAASISWWEGSAWRARHAVRPVITRESAS